MDLQQRISAFVKLGDFIKNFVSVEINNDDKNELDRPFFDQFESHIKLAQQHNGWFTKDSVIYALTGWSKLLTYNNLNRWTDNYNFKEIAPKKVAIIMAGNIPLVGFHDFLSVLICGHKVIVKQSSNDKFLLPIIAAYLIHIEPDFENSISFTEEKLTDYDAVIATGSDNTARYFEYYFKGKASIIRKNRNSVAVLTGQESDEQLKLLSEDVFRYYGLGCRNVSKLYVPQKYDFNAFFNGMYDWHPIIHQNKYANNYDYNKAVYLMSEFQLLENGFLMLKEDSQFGSPIATLFYEYYNDLEELNSKLGNEKNQLQCIVSNGIVENSVPFGETQKPQLWDYADNVDTVAFLLKI